MKIFFDRLIKDNLKTEIAYIGARKLSTFPYDWVRPMLCENWSSENHFAPEVSTTAPRRKPCSQRGTAARAVPSVSSVQDRPPSRRIAKTSRLQMTAGDLVSAL